MPMWIHDKFQLSPHSCCRRFLYRNQTLLPSLLSFIYIYYTTVLVGYDDNTLGWIKARPPMTSVCFFSFSPSISVSGTQ